MRRLLMTILFLLTAAPALAQTAVLPTKWEARVYLVGAAKPISTATLLAADVTCDLAVGPQPSGSIRFTDPARPTRDCQWVDPGTGVIRSRPVGVAFEGTVVPIHNDIDGPGPESARASFRLPAIPAVPGSVRFVGGS